MKTRKISKKETDLKCRSKLSLLSKNMIVCAENPTDHFFKYTKANNWNL